MADDPFDFDLPPERIALRPARPRDAARMLVVGAPDAPLLQDRGVADLPDLLRPGDLLVVNDTRVLPARLTALRRRPGGTEARVELTLHHRDAADRWRAFARPAKRLRSGDLLDCGADLRAEVVARSEGEVLLAFECGGAALDAALAEAGAMPLPPYIASRRPADADDRVDYQTVYADRDGSGAAPTAGLHFTDALLAALDRRGVGRVAVTLHVGAGTFLPVKTADPREHRMHAEWGEVTAEAAEAIDAARRRGGRIVAVGTTALRLLESAVGTDGAVRPFVGETDLFILPGFRFKAADILMTNFHLPRSTLFMLTCAFRGTETVRAAYAHAVAAGYRFYSYGDASLLFRAGPTAA
jgi:S-adenosylmethionine:tRNA ribosyltransferase-isomerase